MFVLANRKRRFKPTHFSLLILLSIDQSVSI
jgi:hypothetical protein